MSDQPIRCMIPARGGSKRVRRKNLQPVGGVPLVVRAYRLAEQAGLDPFVSTEDGEIAAVCEAAGLEWEQRPDEWSADSFQIDDLAPAWQEQTGHVGALVVLQPSTLGIDAVYIADWVKVTEPLPYPSHATVNGVRTGLRIYPTGTARLVHQTNLEIECSGQMIDMDTPEDLAGAHVQLDESVIVLVAGGPGYGHLRRADQLEAALYAHRVYRVDPEQWAADPWWADVTIFDKLATTRDEVMDGRRSGPVVTFEDDGPGADHADLVVNALYGGSGRNRVAGPDWAVIRPEFMLAGHQPRELLGDPLRVLVSFGGVDESKLTEQATALLADMGQPFQVVLPQGRHPHEPFPHMAAQIAKADVVITSCGRTLYEAAAVGTPALAIAANIKETTHNHLGTEYGNMYLGYQREGIDRLPMYLEYMRDWGLRRGLSERARGLSDWRGLERIVWRIEGLLRGL